MVEDTVEQMQVQLDGWAAKIDDLTAGYLKSGAQLRFNIVMYMDELRGLQVVARSQLDAYRAASIKERTHLAAGLKIARDELAGAIRCRPPARMPG